MKPTKEYNGRSRIRMYNCDCMELLNSGKTWDLAIVDPPYGLERFKKGGSHLNKYGSENGIWNNTKPTKEYFDLLFSASSNQIIWGANNFKLPTSEYFIVWQKSNAKDFSFAMCEMAWTSCRVPAKIYKRLHVQENEKRIVPTQKPVQLYKWLLTNYAKEGDTILDTHGGSMSIAIACWDLKFDLDICELDKDYFDSAVDRFEKHISQTQMF